MRMIRDDANWTYRSRGQTGRHRLRVWQSGGGARTVAVITDSGEAPSVTNSIEAIVETLVGLYGREARIIEHYPSDGIDGGFDEVHLVGSSPRWREISTEQVLRLLELEAMPV